MLIYQIKIRLKPYKPDEFIDSMNALHRDVRHAKGCLDFRVYRDSEKKHIFSVVGEWKTQQDMENHFHTDAFKVLVGSARVLGEAFEMNICKVTKSGGIELAKEKIASPKTGAAAAF